jgi:NADH-quinone oxidoreductase subunit N
MTTDLLPEFLPGMPEIFLCVFTLTLLLWGVLSRAKPASFFCHLSLVALLICLGMTILVSDYHQVAFHGMFATNKYTQLSKVMIIGSAMAILLMTNQYLEREKLDKFEYPLLLLFATLGMMAMVSSNDLIAMFMSIEVQSISLYIAVAFARKRVRANEAGIKYFILGTLASIFILFGSSLLYGFTGTIEFQGIASVLKSSPTLSPGVISAFLMIFIGVGFKISLVPFHMWTPDVYEGSPTAITSFLASAPKIAAFTLLIPLIMHTFSPLVTTWKFAIIFFSLASISLGAFAALFQKNLKRLLAYSTISHMGFALLGLLATGVVAVQNVLVYLMLYVTMIIGVFGCLLSFSRHGTPLENIEELTGLGKDSPVLALCFSIFLFSLAGIPPFAGFFAKFGVFKNAIEAGYYIPVLIAVLASVVSAAYYLKIIKAMYFETPLGGEMTMKIDRVISRQTQLVIVLTTLITTFYIFFPNYFLHQAKSAASFFSS